MKITDAQLKILLLGANLLSSDDFAAAEKEAKQKDESLAVLLVEKGLIKDNQLGQIVANYLSLGFADIARGTAANENLAIIPEVVARNQEAVVFKQDKEKIFLATSQPDNYEFFKILEKKVGKPVEVLYATPLGIRHSLQNYKNSLTEEITKVLKDIKANPESEDNIVKLVNLILEYSSNNRASDIHIEPLLSEVTIRFRIDGVLHEVATYPKELHNQIVFRIKILSRIRTDEQAAAQDGRMSYIPGNSTSGEGVDVRVSIIPTTEGENIVMRLLASNAERLTLSDVGLLEKDLKTVKKASTRSYGMILAVGPTGSGKTTSLYAILQLLNRPEVNIMTIEDPVEYNVEHVQQTQVNREKDLTFATGLRSIVRQDPDIVMVGEIRDNETAKIAVNAAMTGHLVLSTLHANNASTTFPRLLDMGVEPFLVSSSVNVVIAQRLVRNICDNCKTSFLLNKENIKFLEDEPEVTKQIKQAAGKKSIDGVRTYQGEGCKMCGGTGYKGRTAIFEVMEVTDELRELITQKASADILAKKANELKMTTMLEDGISKVIQGTTTIEEVLRATKS